MNQSEEESATPNAFSQLRQKAEELLKNKVPTTTTTTKSLLEILHDYDLLAMQLEIQNQELQKSQFTLLQTQEEYTNLYDFAPVGYVTLSPRGVIQKINLTAVTQFSIDRHHLLGSPFTLRIHNQEQKISFRNHLHHVFETKEPASIELELVPWKKPIFYAQLYTIYYTPTMANTAIIDITEQKHARQELEDLRRQLEEKVASRTHELEIVNHELRQFGTQLLAANTELESFSSTVAHDLRTPLRSIAGFSQILLEECSDHLDEKGKDYLKRIVHSSLHMSSIIEDMLSLSRASRAELNYTPIDLSNLAHTIIKQFENQDPNRHITIRIQPNLTAYGDILLITRVLENLLNNAWKFTAKQKNARIEFGAKQKEGTTVFFVRDNGIGFENSYSDKLFKPFVRVHEDSSFPGTGMGLAIVSRIISKHHGKVWAEGRPGDGATIFFVLPEIHPEITRPRTEQLQIT